MGFLRNQFLKVIEWEDITNDTMVYKFPLDNKQVVMNKSVLIVRESQVAIFVHEGKIADVFTPGSHTLTTANLPVLTAIASWKYLFESPHKTDVYFVNTKQFFSQKWGTQSPITMRDKEFGTVRLRGFGTYAFKVKDASLFLKEVFGTNSWYKTSDLQDHLKSLIVTDISDTIAESKIAAIDLASQQKELSTLVKNNLKTHFKEIGLDLTKFVLENISFPEEIEKALDTRTSMGVMSKEMDTFVKYQSAQAIRDAAKNEGGMSSVGAGLGAGIAIGEMIKQNIKQTEKAEEQPKSKGKFCSECGTKISCRSKFCPECGAKQTTSNTCANCNAELSKTAKFCPECGTKVIK